MVDIGTGAVGGERGAVGGERVRLVHPVARRL